MKLRQHTVLGLAVAALAAPTAALAETGGYPGLKSSYPQLHELHLMTQLHATVRPDDRGGVRGGKPQPVTTVRSDNRGGVRGPGPAAPANPSVKTGFDWGDAGIGAVTMLGLTLLVTGSLLVLQHRRILEQRRGSHVPA